MTRSRFNPKGKPSIAEAKFMHDVKHFPCIVCYPEFFDGKPGLPYYPCANDYDHITDSGRRLGHMYGIPLCYDHHRGNKGYSGNKKDWDTSFSNQLELCRKVYAKLGMIFIEPSTKIVRKA